jgi:hypothetical protein
MNDFWLGGSTRCRQQGNARLKKLIASQALDMEILREASVRPD